MTKGKRRDRHSRAVSPILVRDPAKLARREARNAIRQFDLARKMVNYFLGAGPTFRFSTSQILQLHKERLDGLSPLAGAFRNTPVKIGQSKHTPPDAHLVPALVQEMCDYVIKNWRRNAIHLCAYVMWRMN